MTSMSQFKRCLILFAGAWGVPALVFAQMPEAGPAEGESYPHPELITELPEIREPLPWWVVTLLVMAAAGLLALLVWAIFRKRKSAGLPRPDAREVALVKLEALQSRVGELPPAEAAHQVSVILREFQLGRYNVPAPYRTSEELYHEGRLQTSEAARVRFGPLADIHDRLAFAPQPSTPREVKDLIEAAIAAVNSRTPPPLPLHSAS